MKTRMFVLSGLIAVLALFPMLVAGEASPGAAPEPLTFIGAAFDNGLNGADSIALSPDGKHVYVAGYEGDAVAVFSRDRVTGPLTFVGVHKDTDPGVDGLNGARSVAVSPDGNHVYVAGYLEGAVAAFSRNDATGELIFVEAHKDGDPGIFYLGGACSVAVSPDGKHVYVAAYVDDAVMAFSRDAATGALSYVGVKIDGLFGVDGLNGAESVTLSPDGTHVYVAGSIDDAVSVFSRDASSGELAFVEVHKDTDPGVDGLDSARSVATSPDGKHVYVAGFDDDAIVAFSRDGSSGALTFVAVYKDSDPDVDALHGATSVTVSPDGAHVYVASFLYNAVAIFRRDGATGELAYVGRRQNGIGGVEGLYGARSVTVSPDGYHVYAAGQSDDAAVAFLRNGSTGNLTFTQVQRGVDGLDGAVGVAVSPGGAHVYVAGNNDDAVAVFERDGFAGALTFAEVHKDGDDPGVVDGLDGARAVALSPDGGHVYVAGFEDDAVAVFKRDASGGELTFVEVHKGTDPGTGGLDGPQAVSISPDGDHVYVASYFADAVVVFSRNVPSGTLTFAGAYKNAPPGIDGLNGAYSIAFSPDGNYVYVAGINDDAVAVFSRDRSTGALAFEEVHKDTDPGLDGLDGANSVAVSPDGRHVYVASRNDNAIVVFSRDEATGTLTFVEVQRDGAGDVDGLDGARSVAVAPDGRHVYVASQRDDAVAVFSRDGATGALTFEGVHKDTDPGTSGLNTADGVAVSPDGKNVYVAGFDDDAVAVFSCQSLIYLPLVIRSG